MSKAEKQAERRLSMALTQQLLSFLEALFKQLDRCIDKRLIRTLLDTVIAIVRFRDRANKLLLSEVGASIASPAHAPGGTTRLSTLLRSVRWDGRLSEHFLWQRATDRLEAMEQQGETPLVLWDESLLEKPESLQLEGLGAVRSSKGKRLTHIKPGFYQPPKGTSFVAGMQWLCLVLVGLQSPPVLAAMQWWTNRGVFRSSRRCPRGLVGGSLYACVGSPRRACV